MQRLFDIFFSGIALLVLSPLLIPIMVLLRITGEGEIFYLQDRVGKDGKTFKLYKFATMLKNSPNILTGTLTVINDPRVLPAGKFLRKTKINELPQLLNILKGEMSVIGPRPQAENNFSKFPLEFQRVIVMVKPGLSGLGSILFRAEETILAEQEDAVFFYDNVITPYKGRVEAWYVDNNSLATYFTLILVTIWIVLFPSSSIVWSIFKGLPTPPNDLKAQLNFRVV